MKNLVHVKKLKGDASFRKFFRGKYKKKKKKNFILYFLIKKKKKKKFINLRFN